MKILPVRIVLLLSFLLSTLSGATDDSTIVDMVHSATVQGYQVLVRCKASDGTIIYIDRFLLEEAFSPSECKNGCEDEISVLVPSDEFRDRVRCLGETLELIFVCGEGHGCICLRRDINQSLHLLLIRQQERLLWVAEERHDDDKDSFDSNLESVTSDSGFVAGGDAEDHVDSKNKGYIIRWFNTMTSKLSFGQALAAVDAALCYYYQSRLPPRRFNFSVLDTLKTFGSTTVLESFVKKRLDNSGFVPTPKSAFAVADFSSPLRGVRSTIALEKEGLKVDYGERDYAVLKDGTYELYFRRQGEFPTTVALCKVLLEFCNGITELDSLFSVELVSQIFLDGTCLPILTNDLFEMFPSLEVLSAKGCSIHALGEGLSGENLETLGLANNSLTGFDCACLSVEAQSSLQDLDLSDNSLNEMPKNLRLCKALDSLSLSDNNITGEGDEGALVGLDALEVLKLVKNPFVKGEMLKPLLDVHVRHVSNLKAPSTGSTDEGASSIDGHVKEILMERWQVLNRQVETVNSALKGGAFFVGDTDENSVRGLYSPCGPSIRDNGLVSKDKSVFPQTSDGFLWCLAWIIDRYEALARVFSGADLPWCDLPVDDSHESLIKIAQTLPLAAGEKITIDSYWQILIDYIADQCLSLKASISGAVTNRMTVKALLMSEDHRTAMSKLPYVELSNNDDSRRVACPYVNEGMQFSLVTPVPDRRSLAKK